MAYGKEEFRRKYKESYDCCQKIINNYYDLDQEYQMIAKQLQQKENIIKEVREYIMSELITEWDIKNCGHVSGSDLPVDAITPILEILDKVGSDKE